MNLRLSKSSKFMGCGIVLSLGWFVLAACDCQETKQEKFGGAWVACIGNNPVLMQYIDNSPQPASYSATGDFNPANWDCSHSNSPQYKGSQATAPYPSSGYGGPLLRGHRNATPAASPSLIAYLPPMLRDLPFTPNVPQSSTPPPCDSTYPDVLQTVHSNALLTRIHTCPFSIVASIPVQSRPLQVAVTPDGSMALVTSFDNAVNFIDLTANKVVYTLFTDDSINPNGIAISPDGTTAYVTNFNPVGQSYIVINIATHAITKTVPVIIQYPSGATLTPDGAQLWLTTPLYNGVDIFDTATNTRITSINLGYTTDVAFNSTGTRAYVTSQATTPGTVNVVDTGTLQVLSSYNVGNTPADITMSYADQFLVVNNSGDGSISVIDLITNKVSTVTVGANPSGIAFVH